MLSPNLRPRVSYYFLTDNIIIYCQNINIYNTTQRYLAAPTTQFFPTYNNKLFMENHIIGCLHVGMLHLQQQGEQVSRSDHQDITDAMHKHRIQMLRLCWYTIPLTVPMAKA